MVSTYSSRQKPTKTPIWRQKRYILTTVGAILLVILTLELTNTTHLFHEPKPVSGTIPSTTQTSAESDNNETGGDKDKSETQNTAPSNSTPTTQKTTAPPVSGSDLVNPSGSFVSNHSPSLRNSPGLESVCITSPGATCTISFTKDGIVKTLESKTANNNGAVIWAWDIEKAGFNVGAWKITATATLNGQSKSTDDLKNLEVNP
jgi:hypothetical protein